MKTRSTKDISIAMYLVLISGIILWLIYGIMIQNWPIILGNAVTFCFAATILSIKIKNDLGRSIEDR